MKDDPVPAGDSRRPSVHVVLSDHGWIIEECARHLEERLPYISVGNDPDPAAELQYYVTYSARRERVSPIEVALFTHREEDPVAARLFDETAMAVDHVVAMSPATDHLIEQLGIRHRSCISPGVDLDRFRPRLKIAVVGRTYHTGRKGEALVRSVMDLPDIDWHFTGSGWPEPGLHLAAEELPGFYRSMDYVLVPATNEGGPMCVLEALACGVPVIASEVGWAADYPHIAFERGSASSLRAVLERLLAERFALREHVAGVTWQNWADAHDRLFAGLATGGTTVSSPVAHKTRVRSVALLMHGAEDLALGGPSVRVPRTGQELARIGLRASVNNRVDDAVRAAEVVHGFNIWTPADAYRMARQVERLERPLVFSPILLDLGEAAFWQADLLRAFRAASGPKDAEVRIDDAFAAYRRRAAPAADFEPGYTAALTAINTIVSATVFLSDKERALFERLVGTPPTNPFLVRNPVDPGRFEGADPDLFRSTYGLTDYVLCVGRLEHRKNQLMLATALASTGIPLVLIGHEPEPEYAELIRRFGGPDLHIVGRIDPHAPLLASAFAGARVFALPSWAEGAPLSALEAAAAGVPMVLSDRSGEHEYFGELADYCDPASMASIRDTIRHAWDHRQGEETREALRHLVRERYDWPTHAQALRAVYDTVAGSTAVPAPPALLPAPTRTGIVWDITTWANNPETLSGIVRVECAIARALLERTDIPVRFVLYLNFGEFVDVPREVVQLGSVGSFVKLLRSGCVPTLAAADCTGFSDLITVGSSWMQNTTFASSITGFARAHGLRLNVMMHDLTPYLFPHWYNLGYAAPWTANCRIVLSQADRILIYSDSTGRDIRRFCQDQEIQIPTLSKVRLADEIGDFEASAPASGTAVRNWFARRPFVLVVGALHARKNYGLLYDVWALLRERMGDAAPHLAIVGGVAWNGQDLARAFREDGRVNTHVRILDDVDDGLLDWLYKECLFTVYPSLYEGWGLPVGESLARGKICLASAVSSMLEIAPDVTDLLPPMDRSAWAARIEHYARSASSREAREEVIRTQFAVTRWAQTTDDMIRALASPTRVTLPDEYLAGALAIFGGGSASPILEEGWYPAEAWGAWSGSRRVTIAFRMVGRPKGDMVLTLVGRVLKRPTDRRAYHVSVNGVACGAIMFEAEERPSELPQSVGRVRVPHEALGDSDFVRVALEADMLTRVSDLDPKSTDVRSLGLGISAFILEAERSAGDVTRFLSTRPEIRTMLAIPPDRDLARMLADHPARPSIAPDIWMTTLGAFVRSGTASQDGAFSASGLLIFAIGTARLRLAEDAIVDLLVDVAQPVTLDVFANEELIESFSLEGGATLMSVSVPRAILGRADPVSIVIARRQKRNAPEFTIRRLRLRQDHQAASVRLLPGETVNLAERVPEVVDRASGRTDLAVTFVLPHVGAHSVIEINGAARRIVGVEIDSAPGAFAADDTGSAQIVDLGEQDHPRKVVIRWSPELLDERSAGSPDPGVISLRQLAPLEASFNAGTRTIMPVGMWFPMEEDGSRWGGGDTLSFWVRPGAATGLLAIGEHIAGPEAAAQLVVTVDGSSSDFEVIPQAYERFAIRVPFDVSDRPLRYVTVSGLPLARPVDLGVNNDARWLSLRLFAVLALPADG